MIAAEAVLTSRGGKTSHAAVVARGMGKVCVCGADGLDVDPVARRFTTADGVVVREGDIVSVDGTAGTVHQGALRLTASEVGRALENGTGTGSLTRAVLAALAHADSVRRLQVRANADTPRTPSAPAPSAPRASDCAAPSTCSSANAGRWSRR